MPANYLLIDHLIREAALNIPRSRDDLTKKLALAGHALVIAQKDQDHLRDIADLLSDKIDRLLRFAAPTNEPITAQYSPAQLPSSFIMIASDGSQISPQKHDGLEFGVINAASVSMNIDNSVIGLPVVNTETELYLENVKINRNGIRLDSDCVDLYRDVAERELLSRNSVAVQHQWKVPVIAGTDGPLEIWGSRNPTLAGHYSSSFTRTVAAFEQMRICQIPNFGYVDGYGSELFIHLLEIALTPEKELHTIRQIRPLLGITDAVFFEWLRPHHRSALFQLKTRAQGTFQGKLAIHFFYLNVSSSSIPHIARIEIPQWISDPQTIGEIQAALIQQCQILPDYFPPYPYILARCDEEARLGQSDLKMIKAKIRQAYLDLGIGIKSDSGKLEAKKLR